MFNTIAWLLVFASAVWSATVAEKTKDMENLPGFDEVIDRLLAATWRAPRKLGLAAEVQRAVDQTALHRLMTLAASESVAPQVRAIAVMKLDALGSWMAAQGKIAADPSQKAHLLFGASSVKRFHDDPKQLNLTAPPEAPPGMPIGSEECDFPALPGLPAPAVGIHHDPE